MPLPRIETPIEAGLKNMVTELNNDLTVCALDCRIKRSAQTSTCIGWEPLYDKYGVALGEDPNSMSWTEECVVCEKTWYVKSGPGQEFSRYMTSEPTQTKEE